MPSRRSFLKSGVLSSAALTLFPSMTKELFEMNATSEPRFKISLAQWSLHRALKSNALDHLDFARKAADDFGIFAVEYVNTFFKDKATNSAYLEEMNIIAEDLGVRQLLIMVDGEGELAEPDEKQRSQAVSNHYKWVDAAKILGCHSIRVNAHGSSEDPVTLHAAAVESLGTLANYAAPMGINVIVENHGGWSSNGKWLQGVMNEVNLSNCGTLPDFGNFCLKKNTDAMNKEICVEQYDRYLGVQELLPFAKAVSAKSYDFDDAGNESTIDFHRMMDLVKESGYHGYIGIEYEGDQLNEDQGIHATKKLLDSLIS